MDNVDKQQKQSGGEGAEFKDKTTFFFFSPPPKIILALLLYGKANQLSNIVTKSTNMLLKM